MRDNLSGRTGFASLLARLGVLFSLFFIMMIALSMGVILINKIECDERTKGLIIASLQCVLVFIIPALIYARISSRSPIQEVGMDCSPKGKQIFWVVLLFIIGLPALNQIIFWNESISFPPSLSGVEATFRRLEEQAQKSTEILLSATSIGGLISGILIIGVLTGFSEELFFRGALQRGIVASGVNPHCAIWFSAFIFSFMHFQFFGFLPRLLLGAFFGYLLYWSGSIWLSAFAHALNNSLVVLTAWLIKNDFLSIEIEKIGVCESGFPWIAIISIIIFLLLIIKGKNSMFRTPSNKPLSKF